MKNKYRNRDSSVKAGDLILTEEPFAYILSSKEQGIRCDNCLERCKLLKCSGCQFVYYCGRVCQKEAWSDHKWECANLKRIAPKVIPDGARLLARVINRLQRGDGSTYRGFYSATSFRMWKDLMSHYSDLKADKKRMDHFSTLCVVLFEYLKDLSLPNTVDLMGLYGRMVINSFTILDMDMNSIGSGIYLASSIIDHSCDPNAVATFDGRTISIRAIKDMPCLDWRHIRISYIDLMKTSYERQMELQENYYFLCQCDRCMDDNLLKHYHAAQCLNTQCDNPISIQWKANCELVKRLDKETDNIQNGNASDHCNGLDEDISGFTGDSTRCNECGTKYTEGRIEAFIKAMEFSELHLQNMKDVDVCKYCLEKQEGVLHPLNVMYAQTLDHAFDALIQLQLWEQACVYAEKLIPCFKFYYGLRHPLLGLLHMKYGKILLYKMDLQKALQQFKCAEKILKITHGDRHPLYKKYLLPMINQTMLESD
ncbi:histone-lysine N-methyltransferase SMYD3 isoform X2 [Epargyreus clarus]|uniref:histone-lysine N-methyltransferase SMYD3 isoform X2 n=1 Tax=Epargyreus clarus TaxID=520877 RepID=UPI003C2EFC75